MIKYIDGEPFYTTKYRFDDFMWVSVAAAKDLIDGKQIKALTKTEGESITLLQTIQAEVLKKDKDAVFHEEGGLGFNGLIVNNRGNIRVYPFPKDYK